MEIYRNIDKYEEARTYTRTDRLKLYLLYSRRVLCMLLEKHRTQTLWKFLICILQTKDQDDPGGGKFCYFWDHIRKSDRCGVVDFARPLNQHVIYVWAPTLPLLFMCVSHLAVISEDVHNRCTKRTHGTRGSTCVSGHTVQEKGFK